MTSVRRAHLAEGNIEAQQTYNHRSIQRAARARAGSADDASRRRCWCGVLLVGLLTLLSMAPMAAYFGWFRMDRSGLVDTLRDRGHERHAAELKAKAAKLGLSAEVADDHAVRSKLWLRYVGRAPLMHGEVEQRELPVPSAVPNLMESRLKYERSDGDGHFMQHPQDPKVWFEVSGDAHAPVYSWREHEVQTAPNGRKLLILHDYSIPKRPDMKLHLLLPNDAADESGEVSHGSIARAELGAVHKIKCGSAACSVPKVPLPAAKPRIIYKSNAGVFLEREGGVWSESNADGGTLLFHWGVIRETPAEIILQDASRGMWLRIRPAPPLNGTLAKGVVLLATGSESSENKDDTWSPWSLLSTACDPQRTCRDALKAIDAENKANFRGPPLHFVFSVTAMQKYEWQSQFFLYWYNTSQTLSKRGSVTRLLTAAHEDHLMDRVPTFVAAPPLEDMRRDSYVPYNKITSILQWIRAKHDELPDDAVVTIMDVDVVLLEDISYFAVDVKRGSPLGAKGFMSFSGDDSPYDRMIDRYCKGCTNGADPLAVPYMIHKTDLLELAPRWLEKCREIRADTLPWSNVKDWRSFKPLQLSWTAEQWAYLLAAAEMGLRHTVREDMSSFTGCGVLEIDEPMIHFSDWTKGIDKSGQVLKWSKGLPNALERIPDVDPNNKCEIDRAMINALKDAHAHVKPTGYKWKQTHGPEF